MDEATAPLTLLFRALIQPQPPVQIVITAGTWIEYSLHQLLRLNVAFPDLLGRPDSVGISYVLLVRLTTAMGIVPSDLRDGLIQFGRIRNKFAHDITTVLTDKDVDKLVSLLPPELIKYLETKPQAVTYFQWVLLLLSQELNRFLPDDEAPFGEVFTPEDRGSYMETFLEMMFDGDHGAEASTNIVQIRRRSQ